MLDPIGGFSRIKDFFISYIETAFRISDPDIATSRRNLLEKIGSLSTVPFIEPVLRYKENPYPLEKIIDDPKLDDLSAAGKVAFVELALSGLFDGKDVAGPIKRRSLYNPYIHQKEMLLRGVASGEPGVVTSGTGSGKTESFMLPILAKIADEAVSWPSPDAGYLQDRWWRGGGKFTFKRHHESRDRRKAMRAIILYPMNALVDDQMVRLRRTLDSDTARAVMDDRFSGNRIFFGQYTSTTPVTGYERHPRLYQDDKEKEKRSRQQRKLRDAMVRFEEDQIAARADDVQKSPKAADAARYIFPSIDGGEMVDRWDMQRHPPDILVTNASMLGTMLSREVEAKMFSETKAWLHSDPDAYFFLVVDELHLIRGSAGTEVSFLIKSLMQRLGLDTSEHMHKLRILASSASLPMEGEDGIKSKKYLRDMFAPFGTSKAPGELGNVDDVEFWKDCVVEGERYFAPEPTSKLPREPFEKIVTACDVAGRGLVADMEDTAEAREALSKIAGVFGLSEKAADFLPTLIRKAADALTFACIEGDGIRATSVERIAERLFDDGRAIDAVRGLMLVRALSESSLVKEDFADPKGIPSFRLHGFIRNVEGLFGSVALSGSRLKVGDLTTERGVSHGASKDDKSRGSRLFELLYCEACGDILIGGQKGKSSGQSKIVELLPSSTELESIPEKSGSEYYDKMTADEFAVFWPRLEKPEESEKQFDSWNGAWLDPNSGAVTLTGPSSAIPDGMIGGYLYWQTDKATQGPKNKVIRPRMAQPFCCPKCGTDYSNRPRVAARSNSPIRAFRTGVAKASQMVATEMFELLHAVRANAKSIVFSDSRMDAANQALEIERLHLRDLRREILATAARDCVEDVRKVYVPPEQQQSILTEMLSKGQNDAMQDALKTWKQWAENGKVNLEANKVSLDFLMQYGGEDRSVSKVTSEFIKLGIHPFDEIGRKTFEGLPWWDCFEDDRGKPKFSTKLTEDQRTLLSVKIREYQYELIDDVIFSNTFFALEETGLAYPSVSWYDGQQERELDAWLRVFASANRVKEGRYFEAANSVQWTGGDKVANKRVKSFAAKVCGATGMVAGLTDVLDRFEKEGHFNGQIETSKLYLKIAKADDPFWRCGSCERVHLHLGTGFCTRCEEPLPKEESGKAQTLWRLNFLGSRIVRGIEQDVPRFRLRCEELSGQTDDFSDRLRKYKDIFVGQTNRFDRLAHEIDMLSVTTTMEVGIDIGSLQTVYQANMPPQRFNYQQRVGRAGRRNQAFSFVATFCRGRSHDAFYFRHPEAITGDPPPAPFLATDHDAIPLRLVRKVWLRRAFEIMRDECLPRGETFPGDTMSPPDVHGEYVPTDEFYVTGSPWPERLRDALKRSIDERDGFIDAAIIDPEQRKSLLSKSNPDALVDAILKESGAAPKSRTGLGQFLAQQGMLPMYGMPTRVRNFYVDVRSDGGGYDDYSWVTMDRDLEMAIFEFAPGNVLVKDKTKHRAAGFTGSLIDPKKKSKFNTALAPLSNWFTDDAYVGWCGSCGSAGHMASKPGDDIKCDDCSGDIKVDDFRHYVSPAAFRSDYRTDDDGNIDEVGQMAGRTLATILHNGKPSDFGNVRIYDGAGATIIHLNNGIEDQNGDPKYFEVDLATDTKVAPRLNLCDQTDQAIERNVKFKDRDFRLKNVQAGIGKFGLMSRKETDAIYVEARKLNPQLGIDLVAKEGAMRHMATRAAAISATHLLVQKAALELDVAPDEFEALEPRLRGHRPMLQIADTLINGSGLCRRLSDHSTGTPIILKLIDEIIGDRTTWPLNDFLRKDHDGCSTSCYVCIQQYQNRRYHPLLDWRLGIAYLRAMRDGSFNCGLDGNFDELPELNGWRGFATQKAALVASMRPKRWRAESMKGKLDLPTLVEVDDSGQIQRRLVVVHPLWRISKRNVELLIGGKPDDTINFVNTFDLERRPLWAIEAASDRRSYPEPL